MRTLAVLLILFLATCLPARADYSELVGAAKARQAAAEKVVRAKKALHAHMHDAKGRPNIHSLKEETDIDLSGTGVAKAWLAKKRELTAALAEDEKESAAAEKAYQAALAAYQKEMEPYDKLLRKALQSRNTIVQLRDKAGRDPEKACRALQAIRRDLEVLQGPQITALQNALEWAQTLGHGASSDALSDAVASQLSGLSPDNALVDLIMDTLKGVASQGTTSKPLTEKLPDLFDVNLLSVADALNKSLRIAKLVQKSDAVIPNDVALTASVLDAVKELWPEKLSPIKQYLAFELAILEEIQDLTQQLQIAESSKNLDLLVQWVDSDQVQPVLYPGGDRNRVLFGRVARVGTCFDLTGTWTADGYELNPEELTISHAGDQVLAVKTGKTDNNVPKGQVSWKGTFDANPFQGQIQMADKGYRNPRWVAVTVTVKSADALLLKDADGWTAALTRVPAKAKTR